MFPFRKPPTKLEIAKKSVSDAAHTLIDALPVAQIEDKFDDLKKSATLAAGAATIAAAGAAHHAGEVASHGLESLQSAASHLGEGVMGAAHSAQSAGQSAAAVAAEKAGIAAAKASAATQSARDSLIEKTQTARETTQSARETLGERAKTAAAFTGNLRERAAHDFAVGGKEARNAKEVAQKAAEREASAAKARAAAIEAKKQAKLLDKEADFAQKEADKTASQAKAAALKAAREAEAAQEQARTEAQNQAEQVARAIAEQEGAVAAEARELSDKAAKKAAKAEAKAAARAREEEEIIENRVEKVAKPVSTLDENESEFGEIQVKESGSNFGWILLGLAIGAVLALLLAPTSGRRSRAAIKDRLGKVGDGAVDATTATADKAVDIAQRVEGLTHKIEAKLAADGEGDDDGTIADRVRSILGHHEAAKGIERLNIDCADGVVTLRGAAVDAETQETLLTAVRTVPGVKDVVADFLDESEMGS